MYQKLERYIRHPTESTNSSEEVHDGIAPFKVRNPRLNRGRLSPKASLWGEKKKREFVWGPLRESTKGTRNADKYQRWGPSRGLSVYFYHESEGPFTHDKGNIRKKNFTSRLSVDVFQLTRGGQTLLFTWSETPRSKRASSCSCCCSSSCSCSCYVVLLSPCASDDNFC